MTYLIIYQIIVLICKFETEKPFSIKSPGPTGPSTETGEILANSSPPTPPKNWLSTCNIRIMPSFLSENPYTSYAAIVSQIIEILS